MTARPSVMRTKMSTGGACGVASVTPRARRLCIQRGETEDLSPPIIAISDICPVVGCRPAGIFKGVAHASAVGTTRG
jgi:hypothetical protein